ncbi:hypothetical protein EW146_g9301 [Bondarzewia mesenterica]|uniref:Uncharacterized protein n=1 Tax=Bondarzewia mesenterica TaxID=1095465 RepID=A0A4S4L7F6_9AGAM|nr:hypothetical protein EW146_g9301 [Bondarzewia mesenterica]
MHTPLPVLHHVSTASEWPAPVRHISKLLQRPLPAYLATGPYPFVSELASGLLQELSDSPLLRTERDEPEILDAAPLSDMLNTLLTTVCELRYLVEVNDDYGPRKTLPLWFTMFKFLAFVCSKDLCIMGDRPFILPRAFPHERRPREVFDGQATMLMSYIVDGIQSPCPPSPTHAEDTGRSHSTITQSKPPVIPGPSSHSPSDDAVTSGYPDEDSSATTSSTPSLDVPFDAHVLSGCGRRLFATLPIVCVADGDNMVSLLISVLYQRRVWGIDEPVVGIVSSKIGTVFQVVLGWLDLTSVDERQLPTAHLAFAAKSCEGVPSIGVFDFCDPESALVLAQFILGLRSHIDAIKSAALKPDFHDLSWRCDDVDVEEGKDGEGDWKRGIVEWASGIDDVVRIGDDARGSGSRNGSSESSTMESPSIIKPPRSV